MHHTSVHATKRFLINFAPSHNRPARHITATQAFREGDNVWLEIPMFEPKHFPCPAKACLDFVANQQGPMFPTKLLGSLVKICFGRLTTFALNWFDHERGNVSFCQLALQRRDVIKSHTGFKPFHKRTESFGKTFASHQGKRTKTEPVKCACE
jgi:hypothetical protein